MTSMMGVPYLLLVALSVALLWGSLLALRGRRWWATVMMVTASGMQVVGELLLGGSMMWMMTGAARVVSRGPGLSSSSSVSSTVAPMAIIGIGAGFLVVLGLVGFAAGFVGFCARSGASERRATELEGLVVQLQDRIRE